MSSAELTNAAGSVKPALTQREWFAGLAMQGLIGFGASAHSSDMAVRAFDIADAMLAESEKRAASSVID